MTDKIDEIVKTLNNANMPQSDFVKLMENFKNPYLVLIACILSLRTNDKTTYPATLRMLELAKTPEETMKVKVEDLEKAIYPVGFHANKANKLSNYQKNWWRNTILKFQKKSKNLSNLMESVEKLPILLWQKVLINLQSVQMYTFTEFLIDQVM